MRNAPDRTVTKPERKKHDCQLMVRLDFETYSAVKAAAENEERSLGHIARRLIENGLRRLPSKTAGNGAAA